MVASRRCMRVIVLVIAMIVMMVVMMIRLAKILQRLWRMATMRMSVAFLGTTKAVNQEHYDEAADQGEANRCG